ncbi:MAG TPA: ATP-binding cassette domain-containing protein [Flavisolibacter sp.]|nr:ATP-binding cassette domain-containing protein [Flavisolibacter sp.]
MHEYTVKSINNKEFNKIVTLNGNGKSIKLKLHRYSIIGQEDKILVSTQFTDKVYVKAADGSQLQVQPHFEYRDELKLGDLNLDLRITELITEADIENYNLLEKYHYKSVSNLSDESDEIEINSGGGRKSILLLYLKLPGKWEAVGYIELQMPLMMCKPRHILFNNPYNNKEKQIQWEKWDQNAIKDHVNQIVRIARVVTAPEFRGLSLSKYLIKSAKEFATKRWHIKGKSPIFMEISAEMLKHIDFVSNAGFSFVGFTEGNISRVCKDLNYMNRGYNVSSGIMSLQKKYLTNFTAMAKELNLDFAKALKKLTVICNGSDVEDSLYKLKLSEYYLYKSVLRLPIPYYLMPLDDYSSSYLEQHLPKKDKVAVALLSKENLVIKNLNITSTYNLESSKYVRAILSGFGLKGDKLNQRVITKFSLTASQGNIVFISGVSGAGKSVLLNLLNKKGNSQLKVNYEQNNIHKFKVSRLTDIDSKLPLIEYFSKLFGIEKSLSALNRAGLSEAFVYLKPYSLLSKGQQYRARFSKLILEDADIWLLDEFCSDLDVLTAKIVASNLKHIVNKYSKIAIVAAANHEHFIDALKPTQIVVLSNGRNSRTISYKDYKNELFSGK